MKKVRVVSIGGEKYQLKGDNRSIVIYEEMTGKDHGDIKTHTENLQFVHSMIQSSARKQKVKFKMSFDQFIDFVDENPEVLKNPEQIEVDEPGQKKRP